MTAGLNVVSRMPKALRPPNAYGDPYLLQFLRANLASFSVWPGEIYYVDPGDGSNDNDGSVDSPLATLNAAIARCVDDAGELIIVRAGSHSVTETVAFNKRGITVVAEQLGFPPWVQGERFMVSADSTFTDGPTGTITAPCRIVGLGFAGRNISTGESLLIQGTGGFSGSFAMLEGCRFPTWFGAINAGIRMVGGALNHVVGCSFDGLFVGFGNAAIVLENNGAVVPTNLRVMDNFCTSVGSGKHFIEHASSSAPIGVVYARNYLEGGLSGDVGKFLDNSNEASEGLVVDNWTGAADKASAFENLTNSNLKFEGNHYEE